MTPTILTGDCVEMLRTLPDGAVDLFVTSPPYDALRTYGGHSWDFEALAHEMFRTLKEGGVACWNVNDSVVDGSETLNSFRQAIYFKDMAGFRVHDTMIYEKLNFVNPASNRYHQMFEYVFILSKCQPTTFNPIKDKKNACVGQLGSVGRNTVRLSSGEMEHRTHERRGISEYGMRGNVWRGKTRGQEEMCAIKEHPAMMPMWLAQDLILSFSNAGDLVADPMAGSGTVGAAAISTGRRAWLCDVNPDYAPIMEASCNVTPGFAF